MPRSSNLLKFGSESSGQHKALKEGDVLSADNVNMSGFKPSLTRDDATGQIFLTMPKTGDDLFRSAKLINALSGETYEGKFKLDSQKVKFATQVIEEAEEQGKPVPKFGEELKAGDSHGEVIFVPSKGVGLLEAYNHILDRCRNIATAEQCSLGVLGHSYQTPGNAASTSLAAERIIEKRNQGGRGPGARKV